MDKAILVTSGAALVEAMDRDGISPLVAMWVRVEDTEDWRLWIVPPAGNDDKHEFYRRIASIISSNRDKLGTLSVSDIQYVAATHPAMQGIRRYLELEDVGAAPFGGNRFDGYYLPEGIILRSRVMRREKAHS